MIKILYIIKLFFIVLILNSCGSGDTSEGGSEIININKLIVVDCNLSNNSIALNDCNGYTCIKQNDTLVSGTNNTILEIIHISNNEKKVCVKQGLAHILR